MKYYPLQIIDVLITFVYKKILKLNQLNEV